MYNSRRDARSDAEDRDSSSDSSSDSESEGEEVSARGQPPPEIGEQDTSSQKLTLMDDGAAGLIIQPEGDMYEEEGEGEGEGESSTATPGPAFSVPPLPSLPGNLPPPRPQQGKTKADGTDTDTTETDKPVKKKRKKKKKLNYFICLVNCKYDSVRRVSRRFGFKETGEDEDWTLFWTDYSVSLDRVMDMKKYQKINHFPGMSEICRKDSLARNMNRMLKLFPKEYSCFPRSWCLPADYGDFAAYTRQKKHKTYILKPESGCQGKGIWVTKNPKDIRPQEHMLCQQYVSKPFLIDGFKFDLRIYVAVTGCDPFRIFVFKDGLARFATTKYIEPSHNNVNNVYMHLTNYAINKNSANFVRDDDCGSKRRISTVNRWMKENNYDVDRMWADIDDCIIKTMISAHSVLKHNYRTCFPNHIRGSACFEILGFDVMMDRKLKPYLIEVNHSPSFHTDAPLDKEIKEALINDTLHLVNFGAVDRKKCLEEERRKVRDRLFQKQNKKETKEELDLAQQKWQDELTKYEDAHMGNFRRIYPEPGSEKYDKFFHTSGSLYQETAAHKARTECARQQREEIQKKQEQRDAILKKKKDTLLRPESPGTRRKKVVRRPTMPTRRLAGSKPETARQSGDEYEIFYTYDNSGTFCFEKSRLILQDETQPAKAKWEYKVHYTLAKSKRKKRKKQKDKDKAQKSKVEETAIPVLKPATAPVGKLSKIVTPYQNLDGSQSNSRLANMQPVDTTKALDIEEDEELERISGLLQRDNLVRGMGIVECVYKLLHCTPGTMGMQLKNEHKFHAHPRPQANRLPGLDLSVVGAEKPRTHSSAITPTQLTFKPPHKVWYQSQPSSSLSKVKQIAKVTLVTAHREKGDFGSRPHDPVLAWDSFCEKEESDLENDEKYSATDLTGSGQGNGLGPSDHKHSAHGNNYSYNNNTLYSGGQRASGATVYQPQQTAAQEASRWKLQRTTYPASLGQMAETRGKLGQRGKPAGRSLQAVMSETEYQKLVESELERGRPLVPYGRHVYEGRSDSAASKRNLSSSPHKQRDLGTKMTPRQLALAQQQLISPTQGPTNPVSQQYSSFPNVVKVSHQSAPGGLSVVSAPAPVSHRPDVSSANANNRTSSLNQAVAPLDNISGLRPTRAQRIRGATNNIRMKELELRGNHAIVFS